jgi:hypothetical protein
MRCYSEALEWVTPVEHNDQINGALFFPIVENYGRGDAWLALCWTPNRFMLWTLCSFKSSELTPQSITRNAITIAKFLAHSLEEGEKEVHALRVCVALLVARAIGAVHTLPRSIKVPIATARAAIAEGCSIIEASAHLEPIVAPVNVHDLKPADAVLLAASRLTMAAACTGLDSFKRNWTFPEELLQSLSSILQVASAEPETGCPIRQMYAARTIQRCFYRLIQRRLQMRQEKESQRRKRLSEATFLNAVEDIVATQQRTTTLGDPSGRLFESSLLRESSF